MVPADTNPSSVWIGVGCPGAILVLVIPAKQKVDGVGVVSVVGFLGGQLLGTEAFSYFCAQETHHFHVGPLFTLVPGASTKGSPGGGALCA